MSEITYIGIAEPYKWRDRNIKRCLYRCFCGKEFIAYPQHIKSGNTTSCGCVRRASVTTRNAKHGLSGSILYKTYMAMIDRCTNKEHPLYLYYGGRGIAVCEKWRSDIMAFINDVSPTWRRGLSLDRIDNNGNYTPDNVRWATHSQQMSNRRKPQRKHFNPQTKLSNQ